MKVIETKIKKINIHKNETVYDLKVKKNNNFFANDLLVHNCSEIPLCIFDSCRLLAINLYSYVSNPFTKKAKFDFDLFKQHIGFVTRIMDDIIDLELEKIKVIITKIDNDPELPEIKLVEKRLWENIYHKTSAGRRTGIGITAEGDMLAALGIQYASKKAIGFSTRVHKLLAIESYRESINLSKERGSFQYGI